MQYQQTSDTISRQAAINALGGSIRITGEENAIALQDYILKVQNRLINLPSIESEIIHCKDCIHRWHSGGRSVAGKWIRIYRCKRHGIEINLNDFCSFADRRICYTKNSGERELTKGDQL